MLRSNVAANRKTLEDAVARLKRDPRTIVTVEVDGLEVEIRAVGAGTSPQQRSAADVFREAGRWEGESTEQVIARLTEARRAGGSGEPPSL
jgi:hypothetical protein